MPETNFTNEKMEGPIFRSKQMNDAEFQSPKVIAVVRFTIKTMYCVLSNPVMLHFEHLHALFQTKNPKHYFSVLFFRLLLVRLFIKMSTKGILNLAVKDIFPKQCALIVTLREKIVLIHKQLSPLTTFRKTK